MRDGDWESDGIGDFAKIALDLSNLDLPHTLSLRAVFCYCLPPAPPRKASAQTGGVDLRLAACVHKQPTVCGVGGLVDHLIDCRLRSRRQEYSMKTTQNLYRCSPNLALLGELSLIHI